MQYKVNTPINHDGILYKVDEIIDLSDHDASDLLRLQAVQPVDQPFAKKVKTPWGENP